MAKRIERHERKHVWRKDVLILFLVIGLSLSAIAYAYYTPTVSETVSTTETPLIEGVGGTGGTAATIVNISANESEEAEIDPNLDTDGDWILDKIEIEIGTNPMKMDTDGDGIDDFNEYYTYPHLLNPNDHTDAETFLAMIPNVEAKAWNDDIFTGGTGLARQMEIYSSLPVELRKFAFEYKDIEVAKKDPVVQWYANHTEIQWDVSRVMIDGEFYYQEYGWPEHNGISYFLTHGWKGVCGNYAWTSAVLFDLKGYQARTMRVEFETPGIAYIDGKPVEAKGHVWTEIIIDKQIYVIDMDKVMPREKFYQIHSDWTPIINHLNNWTISDEPN